MACNISGRVPGITVSIAPRRDRDPVVPRAPQSQRAAKIPVALPASRLVPLEPADLTEPAKKTGKPAMTAQATPEGTPKGAWKITFLLFLFMLVNFADKIVVGLAGAPIMDELKLVAGAVRPARLLVLLPVFDLGHRRRLHRQPRRHPLGAAGDGGDLVGGAVSDGRHRQFHHAADLPHHPRRRRGAGLFGGGARDLQMVSRREANAADRHSLAGLGLRRDPGGAGAELDHRQS